MHKKRILIFQHLRIEHPGIFREFFKEDDFEVVTIELDEGESIPDLNEFDALWVMGGPMDVWQEDKYPWLIDEKAAIRKAVRDLKMPYVGICLGHQLLADALGGEVGPGDKTEVGIMQIHKTDAGKQSPFLNHMSDTMNCLQWHAAEVKAAPAGMDVLVSSKVCGIQSLSKGSQVFTTQYHQEIIDSTVSDWSDIPAYKKALEKTLGKNAAAKLEKEALEYMNEFNKIARQLYENWKSVVFLINMCDDMNNVQSPCLRNCCLNENDICLGCFRSLSEILVWGQANSDERNAILLNAKERAEAADSRYP